MGVGAESQRPTFHGVAGANVSRRGTHLGGVFAADGRRPSSRSRHRFAVRPVTQRRHADARGQDDESQEEEKPRGGVQAEATSHDHDVGAPFPLSKRKYDREVNETFWTATDQSHGWWWWWEGEGVCLCIRLHLGAPSGAGFARPAEGGEKGLC